MVRLRASNAGCIAAHQFVNTKASRSYQRHHQNGSADQRSSMPPDFRDEYSTGR